MIKLPLYPELPKRPIQEVEPLDRNADCARCSLHQVNPAGSRCIPANGQLGDILVIGDSPTELERKTGLAFTSSTGKQLRKLLGELAPGRNVVYTYALGCKPGRDTDFDRAVSMCRPYLAKVIEECNPKIILLVGSLAGSSVLDLGYNWQDIRNGFAWLHRDTGSVPVYMLPTLSQGYRNHLVMKALREDLRKALIWGPHNTYKLALTASYAIINDAQGAEQAYVELKSAGLVVATDVETSGMMFEPDFRIECLAVANRDFTYVFSRSCLEDPNAIGWLRRILQELDHTSWNGQYDLCAIECEQVLHPNGRDVKRPLLNLQSDARLKRKIGDSEAAGDLATCANLVGMGGHKDEQHGALEAICGELRALALATTLTPTGRTRKSPRCLSVDPTQVPKQWLRWLNDGYSPHKFAHRFVPKHIEHRYVALDAYSTVLLEELCTANLLDQEDDGQITIWEEVTKPSMYAWARAKLNGFPTDKGAVQLFSDYLKSEAELCLKKIHAYKPDLNPRSSQQVGKFLNDLGLKSKRKTDSNEQSWSKDVLEGMKDKHPIIPLLLRYKLLTHTDTNFAGGMLSDIRSDGRVHPSYLQDGTASGRPSCTDPNFFNRLKGRDAQSRELGNMLRSCHKAPPGWSIIEADMGQIEIRLAAYLSQDAAMIAMLNSGVDFHTRSAELFAPYMGKDLSKMTQEEKDIFRENCKTSNFAAIYEIPSQLGFMLSKRLGIDKGPANDLGRAMFKTYTGLRRFMDTSYAEAYANGYTRTHWKGKPARKRPMIGMGKNPPTLSDLEKELRFNRGDDQGTDEDSPEGSGSLDVTAARGTYNTDVQGCYPGHMKILTKSGYIPIIEAPEFGEVWTGSAWKPYKRLDRGEAQLADIYLSNGHIHHCDVRHKLLTETADGYEFKHYSDLQPGDKVCLSLAQPKEFGDSPVSAKEAYWMGFAIGNGCTRQRNLLAVTFGDRKGRYNRIDKSSEFREFVHGIGFQDRNDFVKSGCLTVNVESKELRERWEELGYPWGCLARDKSIPTCIWTANLEARKQFLIGLLDADGTVGSRRSAANLHMASRELLQQAQLLFRTVGVTSTLMRTTATSWRLCLNSMQASQELAYGMCGGTKLIISDEHVPAFLVRKFIELCPKWPSADRSGYTLHSRMKSGGYTNVYTFLDMAKRAGVDLGTPVYSTSRVVKKVDLGTTETTYTLSVSDPGHRFDCEGVIAKNSAVDIITSMLKPVTDWLDANTDGGQFILQIYDSIMLLVKDEDLDKTLKFLVSLMKDEQEPKVGYVSGIPLVVDVKVGKSWDSLKKVKLT